MPTLTEEKEAFKKDLDEFISYWEQEAKELKQREITEEDSRTILFNFELAKAKKNLFGRVYKLSMSDYRKIDLVDNKLRNSLAIAKSNFRRKHRNYWERLIDNIGGLFHFLKRD